MKVFAELMFKKSFLKNIIFRTLLQTYVTSELRKIVVNLKNEVEEKRYTRFGGEKKMSKNRNVEDKNESKGECKNGGEGDEVFYFYILSFLTLLPFDIFTFGQILEDQGEALISDTKSLL
jgi:hypothetical protein